MHRHKQSWLCKKLCFALSITWIKSVWNKIRHTISTFMSPNMAHTSWSSSWFLSDASQACFLFDTFYLVTSHWDSFSSIVSCLSLCGMADGLTPWNATWTWPLTLWLLSHDLKPHSGVNIVRSSCFQCLGMFHVRRSSSDPLSFLFQYIKKTWRHHCLLAQVPIYLYSQGPWISAMLTRIWSVWPATVYGWTILSQWASLIGISLKSLLWHIHGESLCCATVSGFFPAYLAGRFKQVLFEGLYISIYRTPGLRDGFYSARTRFHSVEDRTLDLRWWAMRLWSTFLQSAWNQGAPVVHAEI